MSHDESAAVVETIKALLSLIYQFLECAFYAVGAHACMHTYVHTSAYHAMPRHARITQDETRKDKTGQ